MRKKRTDVKINDSTSLTALMQETYNDACLQSLSVQGAINELVSAAGTPETIDDLTKIAKEKANLLKVKDSAIRIKLEIAKLQSDIIKSRGDGESDLVEKSTPATFDDFRKLREMLKNQPQDEDNDD